MSEAFELNGLYDAGLSLYEETMRDAKLQGANVNKAKVLAKNAVYAIYPELKVSKVGEQVNFEHWTFWSRVNNIVRKYYPNNMDDQEDSNGNGIEKESSVVFMELMRSVADELGWIPPTKFWNIIGVKLGFSKYIGNASMANLSKYDDYEITAFDYGYHVTKSTKKKQVKIIEKMMDEIDLQHKKQMASLQQELNKLKGEG